MNSPEIRQRFFDFFEKNGHTKVPSSSLIPAEDPTLLFANAGMNQFKDSFLGNEKRSYTRAVSIQKCVRAGGKHNDLDQVGYTERHLTFFEMMGNFSFGDYFKKEAIQFAWDFLTQEMKLDPDRLYPTVFKTDDESYDLWHTMIGVPKKNITRLGEADNFWQMGETGPCGPCSEVHYDRGAETGCGKKTCAPGCECPRYNEVWNLVFMQYNKGEDGSLKPLTQKGVDTGMGLERLCMISQDKHSVFETDLFTTIHQHIEELTGHSYAESSPDEKTAFHVLSDHIRTACLIIADGGTPSNDGRGYVLRKIIRRAALFAQKLSDDEQLFPKLAPMFIDSMAPIYPELKTNQPLIEKLLEREASRFATNLLQGQAILQSYIEDNLKEGTKIISGAQAFKLYDTYGFPPELTTIIAGESNFSIDTKGFEKEMQKQQAQSGKKIKETTGLTLDIPSNITTKFAGYETLETTSPIVFTHTEDAALWIVTEESPFYVESGGQVNDKGWVTINDLSHPVTDLKKVGSLKKPVIAVKLKIKDPTSIKVGDSAHCVVDATARLNTVRNHTATHLLQAALIQVLGKTIKQAGSVVNEEYLRFDFTHHEPMTKEQIATVETLVNQKIQDDIETNIYETTLSKAKDAGVISFFGEKYNPENVRVVEVPGFSAELCGGTHASRTGIIGSFKIVSEASLSAGVRRIVAISGPAAVKLFGESYDTIKTLAELFKAKPQQVLSAVQRQQKNLSEVQSELKSLKKQLWKSQIPTWTKQIDTSAPVPFLYLKVSDFSNEDLKHMCQELEKQTPGFYFLVSTQGNSTRISFLAHLSKEFSSKVDFKAFATFLKDECGLRGGGSATMIQGGGTLKENLVKTIRKWLDSQ